MTQIPHRFSKSTEVQNLAGQLNENFDIIDQHFDKINPHPFGRLVLDVSGDQNVALTAEQARNAQLVFTGTLTADISVILPSNHMVYHVQNLTSGDYTLTIKTGAGTGVPIQQANLPDHPRIKRVMVDGTDVVWADGSQIVEDNLHEANPDAGYYIRWANRLQKCWNYLGTIEELTPATSSSNLPLTVYYYDIIEINFPKPFATRDPFIVCNANTEYYGDMYVQALSKTPNHFDMRIHSLAPFRLARNVSYMAVGIY